MGPDAAGERPRLAPATWLVGKLDDQVTVTLAAPNTPTGLTAEPFTSLVLADGLVQGVAAAFMNPLSQTVMMDINPRSRQASAMSIWGMGVMVGPVLGPVIGGYLTENYDWRWVFFINVPIGIACFSILWALLPSRPVSRRSFDAFGFGMLALAISAFQIMLDRGQSEDWFQSTEVVVEALVAVAAAWMFVIHMITAEQPMFDRAMFRDRNLVTGMAFMVVMGLVMMATMALLPPMLQSLYGYPVFDTGVLLMPRGIGIFLMMWVAGRLLQRGIDPRILITAGFTIAAISLYQMTTWTIVMESTPFVVAGLIQGIGMGLIFIPLNLTAFGTIPGQYRTEATSLMNLCRNIGASAGISAVTAVLARNVQTSHMELGGHITGYSLDSVDPSVSSILGSAGQAVTAMLDAEVTRQALMIAYLDDFKLMMIVTFLSVPLVFVLRRAKAARPSEPVHAAVD